MARVKIQPGGKVLVAVIGLGVLLFLFFEIRGATRPVGTPPPPKMIQSENINPTHQALTHPDKMEPPPVSRNSVQQAAAADQQSGPVRIFFDFNRAGINKNVYCIFDMIQSRLRNRSLGKVRIMVQGNADAIGPAWYNKILSGRRAERVIDSLSRRLDVPRSFFEIVANGSTKPISSNATREGRSNNRRVEISIY